MTENRVQRTEKRLKKFFCIFCTLFSVFCSLAYAQETLHVTEIKPSEIPDESHSQVIIREHPKTGKPYVSIVSSDRPVPEDPFTHQRNRYSRPDYRMLDPKAKKGDYHYDGPVSDRTKVYIFGATLIAGGITGGTLGMALAPASTAAAGAGSGGGTYLAGAAGVAALEGAAVHEATRVRPEDEHFVHESESRTLNQAPLEAQPLTGQGEKKS